jgi:hypothetical protein
MYFKVVHADGSLSEPLATRNDAELYRLELCGIDTANPSAIDWPAAYTALGFSNARILRF